MGHFDPFPPRRLNGRCPFSQPTSAGASGNGKDAPFPAVALHPEAQGGLLVQMRTSSALRRRIVSPWSERCESAPLTFIWCTTSNGELI
jgi:hypothetical protein